MAGTGGPAGRVCLTACAEMGADFFGLMFFQRTGMGLFFGDPDFLQYIEDRLAFDFQLSSQIIDSNLAHPPPGSSSGFFLSLHRNLTAPRSSLRCKQPNPTMSPVPTTRLGFQRPHREPPRSLEKPRPLFRLRFPPRSGHLERENLRRGEQLRKPHPRQPL